MLRIDMDVITTTIPPWTVPKSYTMPIPPIVVSNPATLLILLSLLTILIAVLMSVSNSIYRDIVQSLQHYESLDEGEYEGAKHSVDYDAD